MKLAAFLSVRKAWSRTKDEAGFSLVEALLASALFALLVTGIMGGILYGEEAAALAGNQRRATLLAEEGLEVIRNIRDPAFSNLTDGTYGLAVASGKWNLSGTSDTTDMFTRQLTISTVDTKRKTVTSTVTWQQNPQRTGSVSLVTRLTNWIAVGIGNWALPTLSTSLDLSGSEDGLKVHVVGNYAYVVRNDGTQDFTVIDISTPSSPTLVGSLSLSGVPTNIYVSGNYAYVTTNAATAQLQIINISTPATPTLVGSYITLGAATANGVFVSGSYAYVVTASSTSNEFQIINVSTPSLPVLTGSFDLAAAGNEVVVSGTYAYVASSNTGREVQVLNVGTPTTPTLAGGLNMSGSTAATSVAISGTNLYIARTTALNVLSVSTPATPTLLGSVTLPGNVNDIGLNLGNSGKNLYVATSGTSTEFTVLDVTTSAAPVSLGTYNVSGSNPLLGVEYSSVLDRAFGVGRSNSQEFTVFAPS